MLDFEKMEVMEMPNFKGGNGIMLAKGMNDENVRIMKATLHKGVSIGEHTHVTNSEIVYVLSGEAHFVIDGKDEFVKVGQCHYCPQGHTHSCINDNDEDLVIFAVVPEHTH